MKKWKCYKCQHRIDLVEEKLAGNFRKRVCLVRRVICSNCGYKYNWTELEETERIKKINEKAQQIAKAESKRKAKSILEILNS